MSAVASFSIRVFSLVFLVQMTAAQYMIELMRTHGVEELIQRCEAAGANFGGNIFSFSLSELAVGCPVLVDPIDACGPVRGGRNQTLCEHPYALVSRSPREHKCAFSQQAIHVQESDEPIFKMAIIYNFPGEEPVEMSGEEHADSVKIPLLMVSYDCMTEFTKHSYSDGYYIRIRITPTYYELFRYLIPFVIVLGFCVMLFGITLCIRFFRERRRNARKRLSKRNLRKIPVRKYKAGDHPDTCAICLEDFVSGEKLRHLPCRHVYHCKCIDPWLTENRKVCPMCKRRVGDDSDSDSGDDSRRQNVPNLFAAMLPPSSQQSSSTLDVEADVHEEGLSNPPDFHAARQQLNEPPEFEPGCSNIATQIRRMIRRRSDRNRQEDDDNLENATNNRDSESDLSDTSSERRLLQNIVVENEETTNATQEAPEVSEVEVKQPTKESPSTSQ